MKPAFPFNDSLIPLNRRQVGPLQTQRGNYSTTWLYAGFWDVSVDGLSPVDLFDDASAAKYCLLFGSDVPHLTTAVLENGAPPQVLPWVLAMDTALLQLNAWVTGGGGSALPVPALAPAAVAAAQVDAVCFTGLVSVERPSALPGDWNATDAGQGALVVCQLGSNGQNVQGFPIKIERPACAQPGPIEVEGALWVGFESQINHGLQYAEPTGADATVQPGYIPIILRRTDYSDTIRNNHNLIAAPYNGGDYVFQVVGLFA